MEVEYSNTNGAPTSVGNLPEELLQLVRMQNEPRFLSQLAVEAIKPHLTTTIWAHFEAVFADTAARLVETTGAQRNEVIEAFARVLHLAPHLGGYLERYLTSNGGGNIQCFMNEDEKLGGLELQRILLASWRLLNFDARAYKKSICGTRIQQLLRHDDRGVRYLAVRIFCQLFSASDFKMEDMIREYVGTEVEIMGDFDGESIDYGFLSLFEERRLKNAHKLRNGLKDTNVLNSEAPISESFSSLVVQYSKTLLPRPNGAPSRPTTLISTVTTSRNKETFAKSLLVSSPILLHGLAGSGKTSLVNDFARELGVDSNMVTLHLNEQTDAKMLIGMYATGSTPGSFVWRAGVLTTAVREGRWVFIEDLDRAPNEVISVVLPLIERGELLIPSRGETIRAGPGFRLLASIRTSLSVTGQENPPALHMLGSRLWQRVPVQMPSQDEFREIIDGIHPILHKFLPGVISVYDRLYTLSHKPSFASRSRTSLGRPISPRDLLKWCRRLDGVLRTSGSKTGAEPITEATQYEMFLEATDCFAGSLQTEETKKTVISAIAEEMHIDPQRVEHYLTSHIPRYEDSDSSITIGRVRLSKRPTGRVSKPLKKSRPFANTTHAKRLLEQVGVAVKMSEPVLLVGETGIGKTTVVQQLADSLGFNLTAVNLSQQSEVGDLLGGFKPVNVRSLAIPLKDEFDELFSSTGISATKNQRYLDQLSKSVAKGQWSKASKYWREAPKMFNMIVSELVKKEATNGRSTTEQPLKRRKTESRLQALMDLKPRWERFSQNLDQFDIQLSCGSKGFAFTFVEGNIVKAARNGDWVLLDEINLASPDTLESIADLLHSGPGSTPSILLSETGEIERVRAHPNFRIFGAMNPATDVGKRDLPIGLRSRFTEIYVDSPDRDLDDLLGVIRVYLKGTSSNDERAAHDVARLYLNTKRLADDKRLVDGASQVPHFSLRTLTRVLSYVTEISPSYGLRRALYEGFAMGFLTLLNSESEKMLMPLINHHLLESHGNPQALLAQTPRHPEDGKQYVRFLNGKKDRQYWMLQGPQVPEIQSHYIMTPFVERNMLNLVRATSTRRFPVLVQGPTSSGKTSMIEYLAKFSGNKFVRINNHEHTDLQEYLGTYVSGSDGQLHFQEGLLVQALRQGHWIVLDELNLAPTDVLEALNRLLDDNRELLIPETQEIVRPHDNFMLFATQNPPGLYGGRKTLSRAFRNRFLELHFDDIPEAELDTILVNRCPKVAPSDCNRIVAVYKELSRLRQSNRAFEQKDSFATLRDLFRWALRDADNREQLAANGYMLLAERVRNPEERIAVKEVIERIMKVKIDPTLLYRADLCPEIKSYDATPNAQGVVWTNAMRRLYVLVAHALRSNEPILLVGETGCGKTTVCQMLAEAFGKELHMVNAHQNTETGDLIGAQRPVRNRAAILEQLKQDLQTAFSGLGETISEDGDVLVSAYRALSTSKLDGIPAELKQRIDTAQVKAKALFEWSDGSLVQAMKEGQLFLLDEISLADDSVLERLNSVLEPARTILLAEKGSEDSFVQAAQGFQFFATMNPGGDYGKRELSPALRNRFTEIWVPSLSEQDDVLQIVQTKLDPNFKQFSLPMVQFAEWFGESYRSSAATSISVRDVLAWVKFMNGCGNPDPYFAVLHGAAMVYIDTLGANPAALLAINSESIIEEREKCLQQLGIYLSHNVTTIYNTPVDFINSNASIQMGSFLISKQAGSDSDPGFAFNAPTTKLNAMRILRALQVQKPILIEGSPGVGKTTLIAALAQACNKPLTRINLSEQTDLMDLFGSDVPVEGAEAGHFAWRDAPFLQAMQRGEWVLLDEMNLATQSVLEGLNACLDHRGEVYISELDQTFKRHPNFSVFAAQNPHHQGGGRKGLPSSFVNRFTVVYADVFRNEDLQLICKHNYPDMPSEAVTTIIGFVSQLEQDIVYKRRFGFQGGPWEFNLRDILRWLQLLASNAPLLTAAQPSDFLNLIFRQRFRTSKDRAEVEKIFSSIFTTPVPFRHFYHNLSASSYQVGLAYMQRDEITQRESFPSVDPQNRLPEMESIMICIQQNLPCILVGPSGCGKTTVLRHIAATSGKSLVVFPLNADIDTMDLVGGFEQVDPQRAASSFLRELTSFLTSSFLEQVPRELPSEALLLLELLQGEKPISSILFQTLGQLLETIHSKTSLVQFKNLAATCHQYASTPMVLENARFEWVDGVLVKALEEGSWLVLDNANLCSASVLDRLNSLLEPNGFLSINEHCGPDGEPKVVTPHAEFRIFLTMDSRFGELSRAMRNRAIEIFLEPLCADILVSEPARSVRLEPTMERFRNVEKVLDLELSDSDKARLLQNVALDNLSLSDMALLSRYSLSCQKVIPAEAAVEFTKMVTTYGGIYTSPAHQSSTTGIAGALSILVQRSNLPTSFLKAQTIHPLQNSPVAFILQSADSEAIFWLATVFEVLVESASAIEAYQKQESSLESVKPSRMNKLQRSLVSGRVPSVAKDSTVKVSVFLTNTLKNLIGYIQTNVNINSSWKVQKNAVVSVLQFWWDTYHLATLAAFEESTFQAHLSIGSDIFAQLACGQDISSNALVSGVINDLKSDFDSGFKLTTGLSMEILWKQFRPMVISRHSTMEILSQMEKLAHRFDTLRWKSSISVTELGAIMLSLVKAYQLVLSSDVDGSVLVKTLSEEMDRLESSMGIEEDGVTPFLAAQFEALRQYKSLEVMYSHGDQPMDQDTIILANYSTSSEMQLSTSTSTSKSLQGIDYLLGSSDGLQPLTDSFSSGLLRKMLQVGEVNLRSLKLLEAEIPILGKKITLSSATLSSDQLNRLNDVLVKLLSTVLGVHDETFRLSFKTFAQTPDSQGASHLIQQKLLLCPTHLQQVYAQTFEATVKQLVAIVPQSSDNLQHSALAWTQFAIGVITLYVPDRAFDPDKRQRLERERHVNLTEKLNEKLSALRQFEQLLTGQESNLRCEILEGDIAELGSPPEILQQIFRPEVSELDQLHGEFRNLLKTVLRSEIPTILQTFFDGGNNDGLQEIRLLQSNVSQIIRRLSERFGAYRDLTTPAVSMLRCLQIGLSMALLSSKSASQKIEVTQALSNITPFLGGKPGPVSEGLISSHPMEYLSFVSTQASIEDFGKFDLEQRESLLRSFHSCYDQWTKRLESDRAEQESKSGLYRFRGSAEDEEEHDQDEFNELFPSFDVEEEDEESDLKPAGVSPTNTARDSAVSLSQIHAKIFLGGDAPSKSIRSLIRHMSDQIGKLHESGLPTGNNNMTKDILPGTLLRLNDQIEALTSSYQVPDSYNFYTDANLPEARKLVTLIHSIQSRFRQLQAVDEIAHMQPLVDVLTSCSELLAFRHTESLAKIITKVEKVHTFVHEWQFGGWASRANSALTQYDELTKTIVDWRRLELSTWGKLFDMETKKCEDDARSWWFVAYQVVFAAPLQMHESPEQLKDYAQKLLKDLETYFATAIQGQYLQRLQLLKQLQLHLELAAKDYPNLQIIHTALSNFISMYAKFEKPVQDHLKKGKVTLEKAMRDVLLLASWKDTNIVALRDSAKRSHHKLFKIVRKFRALLGQPMDVVIKQGLPEETSHETEISSSSLPIHFPSVDLSALALCAESVPNWTKKSKRFINVSKTVSMMVDASQISESAVEGTEYLDSFLANIIASAAELQEATPTILTEDNKDTVKHLKSRKRKLFAETLRELKVMGIKYNLGTDALAKQESLSIVLSSTDHLTGFEIPGLEYYFYKSMDLTPRAREAVRGHSDDLSGKEVERSTGFLEGLIQTLVTQRNELASSVASMKTLEATVSMAKGLWAPNQYEIRAKTTVSSHGNLLQWLPNILIVALDLVKVHSKLSKIDSKGIQDQMSSWIDNLQSLSRQWKSLHVLPSNIVSTESKEVEQSIVEAALKVGTSVREIIETRPDLSFILSQVLPWINITSSELTAAKTKSSLTQLDQKLSIICDSVLVAVEKHKKAISELPTSTEDDGWLVKNDLVLVNTIKSLHIGAIGEQLTQAFDILRTVNLEDSNTNKIAGAVFAVALPILQQYSTIVQDTITRYGQLHRSTCKTSYILAKTFIQIATQGFCTPSEKADAQDGKTEKLEGGTGLGDGEGAEDISKDIQDDENLDELAQEPNAEKEGDMEDEQDAVDMADGEMEGEMGDAEKKGDDDEGSGDEEDGDDMDEEAGDVDDLDPTAVDEKMWDGDREQAEKDQEGDDSKGKASKDEQVAGQDNQQKNDAGEDGEGEEEEEEMEGAEQGEEIKQDEVEKHDPHAEEGEALDLPEDMELDGDENEGSEKAENDKMNELSDAEDGGKMDDEVTKDGKEEEGAENADPQEDQNMGDELDIVDLDEEDEPEGEGDKTEEAGEKDDGEPEEQSTEDPEGLLRDRNDEANADADNAVPSDVQGVGEDQDDNVADDKADSARKAQREDGGQGGDSSEQQDAAAEDGEKGRQANGDARQDSKDETQDSTDAQPFKKLGDALESWHRQQTQIRDPTEQKEQPQDQNPDPSAEASEFQHLQDEDAEADNQAMGTATEEQARALDESMAVDAESKDMPDQFQPDEVDNDEKNQDDVMDLEETPEPKEQETSDAYEGRAGAMIKQANEDRVEDLDNPTAKVQEDIEEEVEEVDNQLDRTHLDDSTTLSLRSATEARQQWTHYEALTRDLSLSLTEQLRLILAPTLATKMRGDFRTGKRLNIKRIIPYIASQYKRDKIWMRRSVPSKRSYQIMLAVDDSKSMGESGSGSLAIETLVMISKSLSMLEVGEICVVGFGEDVKVAHDFDTPFSSDAGPSVFQKFSFDQPRTDVTKLVRESISLFRTARTKASSSPADLWQMQLIISDGVCDSSEHEPIRRLLREAIEERIMMVFVIVDDLKNKKKGESVMDLKEAKFVKDERTGQSNVRIERYLDTFPFQYYLIVSDVKELPGVLATVLRQWFAEVVDAGN